jgi:serine/threonine protein kinase
VQEAKAAASLNHPHIVTIHDTDEADGVHFIAMEYVSGEGTGPVNSAPRMRLNEALKMSMQIAECFGGAHVGGIVQRSGPTSSLSLNPAN